MAPPIKDWIALTAKLKRAEEHIFNLREFWSGFIDAGAYPILSQDVPDRSYRLYYLGSVEAIPADVPLIIGDAIQILGVPSTIWPTAWCASGSSLLDLLSASISRLVMIPKNLKPELGL